MKKAYLISAMLWTLALCLSIGSMILGQEPDWVLVYCPLIALCVYSWNQYAKEYFKEMEKDDN